MANKITNSEKVEKAFMEYDMDIFMDMFSDCVRGRGADYTESERIVMEENRRMRESSGLEAKD